MEEKNIRWGELAGGLLIVGSAVGLVVSLWATLKEAIPYLPSLLFMLLTAGLHGIGHYTLRHWKLEATSRRLLVIATLLVPLNFLVLVALSEPRESADPFFWISGGIAILAFGFLTRRAGRILMPDFAGWFLAANLGGSAVQLLIGRISGPDLPLDWVVAVAAVPAVIYVAVGLRASIHARRETVVDSNGLNRVFLLLAMATFALVLSQALLVHKAAPTALFSSRVLAVRDVLGRISPIISICAAPLLAFGLIIHRRIEDRGFSDERLTGTAMGLASAIVLLAAVVLAWPRPGTLIAVGFINASALTMIACISAVPILHLIAQTCLALAYLTAVQCLMGTVPHPDPALAAGQLTERLTAGSSAVGLAVHSFVIGAGGVVVRRLGRCDDGDWLGLSALGSAAMSTVIAAYAGFWSRIEAQVVTPVFWLAAAALLVANRRLRTPWSGWAASSLLLVGLVHVLGFNTWFAMQLIDVGIILERPIMAALLLHASLATAIAWIARFYVRAEDAARIGKPNSAEMLINSFGGSACWTAILAMPSALQPDVGSAGISAALLGWSAVIWLALSVLTQSPAKWIGFQLLATLSTAVAVFAWCEQQPWWGTFDLPILDARHVQAQSAGLLFGSLVWTVTRILACRLDIGRNLLEGSWLVARLTALAAIACLMVLSVTACLPGILAELFSPATVRIPSDPTWHSHAYGLGSWLVLIFAVFVLVVAIWDRGGWLEFVGLIVTVWAAALLVAAPFETHRATASALRWNLAVFDLLASAAIWQSRWLPALAGRIPGVIHADGFKRYQAVGAIIVQTISALPVAQLSLVTLMLVANDERLGGPIPPTMFWQMGPGLSHGLPLAILAATVAGYAIHYRAPALAFASGLVGNFATTIAFLFPLLVNAQNPVTAKHAIELVQWNVLISGLIGLAWLAMRRWIEPALSATNAGTEAPAAALRVRMEPKTWLSLQLGLPTFGNLLLLGTVMVCVIVLPMAVPRSLSTVGTPLGATALLVTVFGVIWQHWARRSTQSEVVVAGLGLAMSALLAAALVPWNQPDNWFCYHALDATWIGLAWFFAAGSWFLRSTDLPRWEQTSHRWVRASTLIGAAVVAISLRGANQDPIDVWPAVSTASIAALAVMLALRERTQRYAYAATLLAVLANWLLWLGPFEEQWSRDYVGTLVAMVESLVVTAAAGGLAWLAVDLWYQRRRSAAFDTNFAGWRVHEFTAVNSLFVAAGLVFVATAANLTSSASPFAVSDLGGWTMLGIVGVPLITACWDRIACRTLPALFVWGLVALAMLFDGLQFSARDYVFFVGPGLAAYSLILAALWARQTDLVKLGRRITVPDPERLFESVAFWLPQATLLLSIVLTAIAGCVVVTFDEPWKRLASAAAVFVAAISTAGFARSPLRRKMQMASLTLLTAFALVFGWAIMDVSADPHFWLHRAIRAMVVLASVAFGLGIGLTPAMPRHSDWTYAVRCAARRVSMLAGVALGLTLLLEAVAYRPELAALTYAQITVVAAALVALAATCISFALAQDVDPFGRNDRSRMGYVYAAEAILALLFLHVYLTMPWLFAGLLRPYWPLIVMAVAFVGIGLGEFCERTGLKVLAEPLHHTGAFLPLLPALGFWIYTPVRTSYSALMFVIGLLYALVAFARRSFRFGLLSALAGNIGLWFLLGEHGHTLIEHPQVWLIPPALSVLVSAHMNRTHLSDEQMTTVRYISVLVIYVSSTADMFVSGVAETLWLPMVLALLSVLGILTGIVLRIRAYLYLGASFLFLSVLSMVYHAYRNINHVWPWWAFGICLGLGMLVLFGLVEKKRNEVLILVDHLRQWEH
jgi:hypothetical protein